MFWKKNQSKNGLITLNNNNGRNSYRIKLSKDEPIIFNLREKKGFIINLSAGGFSFYKTINFKIGGFYIISFNLPGIQKTIKTGIRILSLDKKKIYHCKFENIKQEYIDYIHQYILKKQKEIIQTKKQNKD